jgi:alkylation response protein AidB-like acyl-CoA dehydrogenase
MDATLSESEELLLETAKRIGTDLACESVAEYDHYDDAEAWQSLAQTGLLGLRFPESAGGGGGTTLDEAIVVEALAYHTVPVPYLGGAAFVGEMLLAANAPDETLSRVARGELRCALGLGGDLMSVWDASREVGGSVVAFDSSGAQAALILDSSNGLRLRAVALRRGMKGLDLTRGAHEVDPSAAVDVGPLGGVIDPATFSRTMARLFTLVAADLVGVMDAGLATAVSYAATREQFGVPIATFQAIQHLCADQLVSLEGARSLTEYAAWAVDECEVSEALLAARSAKAYASRAGRAVTEAVVQVHGGMGFTWDCPAHVFLKRALTDARVFADSAVHIREIAELRSRGNV